MADCSNYKTTLLKSVKHSVSVMVVSCKKKGIIIFLAVKKFILLIFLLAAQTSTFQKILREN